MKGTPKCLVYTLFPLGTFKVKAGFAQMAKGGIVMDVVNAEQAKIAEAAGVGINRKQCLTFQFEICHWEIN